MYLRQFFRVISQTLDYIQTFCNDSDNPFHFACRRRYSYNNPQVIWYSYTKSNTTNSIIIRIIV